MKIDRLFGIFIYLLNREKVSAKELSEKFDVSVRTIQRDIDSLCNSGVPVSSAQGAKGGFGIIDSYKLDKTVVDHNDLFMILTSLESISATYDNKHFSNAIEKIKNLTSKQQTEDLEERKKKLSMDFSSLNIGRNKRELFYLVERGIENQKLLRFKYNSNKMSLTERIVEPMTIVFKWYSWYLFAYCHLREDYRMFRLSRIRDAELLEERFWRRKMTFEENYENRTNRGLEKLTEVKLKFCKEMKYLVEDYFTWAELEQLEDGCTIANIKMPNDHWLHGMILSYGEGVEVLEPADLRVKIKEIAKKIQKKY
jgi:predicted DNA-binding transcriptional regulator YafY